MTFVSAGYRLAPQHVFPAALDDCAAAMRWVYAHIGEHGGDPASILFCDSVGLDYVSCSPYRVPIARLAAAQAALAERAGGKASSGTA